MGTSTHLVPTSEFGQRGERAAIDLGGQNVNGSAWPTFCAPMWEAKAAVP